NYEFNVSNRDYDHVKFATDEFEQLWKESIPILEAEAQKLKKKTYLRDDFTPFQLYIKMLIEYFGKRVEYDPYNIDLLLPEKFMKLKYQSDAANQGYAIMMKHNGCILADVVGLGKTIIACMMIKKFIYENGTHTRVLIVIPPALEENWRTTAEDFQIKNHFEFITTGSLHKILDEDNYYYSNAEKFDMVVIDESHKFRNDYTNMYLALQEICKKPRVRPAENGDTRKKVILLSATPLNNRPKDIENQLYLFQDRRNSTLENIRNLQDYFKPINDQYKKLSSEKKLNIGKLKQLFQKLRDDVVEPLVIRRTRTDLEKNEDYLADMEEQGLSFPKVGDPIAIKYELDEELTRLFFDTVSLITGLDEEGNEVEGLGYYRYRAIEFLAKEEDQKIYGNVGQISGRLSAIMKTLLVKRLESSFYAFKQSIQRFHRSIEHMLKMFENDRVFIAPDLDINKLLEESYSYDQIEEKINAKEGNNREFEAGAFGETFLELLEEDKKKLKDLVDRWAKVNEDPKLNTFLEEMENTFLDKKKNPSGKIVIFTESKETAQEISENLKKVGDHSILKISAENRKQMERTIQKNFDANYDPEKQENKYDVIITTEVLAEGINLHRSNTILNYDVPWNSTRLMQRIGRVNRIGSTADRIYVYNFYPSAQGDSQIRLVNTVLRKLQAFHTAFGEDNKIFSLLEEKGEGALFGNKIQKEESESLKYLKELREFKKNNPEQFAEIEKIPSKARCGRDGDDKKLAFTNSDNETVSYPLPETSLAYLKSDNHPGVFCFITKEGNTEEINFLQAVKIYKAEQEEQSVPFHENHYKHTQRAMKFFTTEKNQGYLEEVTKKNLSPAENKALTNLDGILDLAPTRQKRGSIQRCIELINRGRFASRGLPKSVNDYFDAHEVKVSTIESFMDGLFKEVLDRYDLSVQVDEPTQQTQIRGIKNPKIVLTQSFS
ncbi:MAG: helicase-related protein, partial [Cyclobacteriaceae bacterium]